MPYAPYLMSHVSCLVSFLCLRGFVTSCLDNELGIRTFRASTISRAKVPEQAIGATIVSRMDYIVTSFWVSPSRINLRDSNPVRGDMFIETGTIKHIPSSVGVTREIAARNTYRSYGAWCICGLSYAINMTLLTEFRT